MCCGQCFSGTTVPLTLLQAWLTLRAIPTADGIIKLKRVAPHSMAEDMYVPHSHSLEKMRGETLPMISRFAETCHLGKTGFAGHQGDGQRQDVKMILLRRRCPCRVLHQLPGS